MRMNNQAFMELVSFFDDEFFRCVYETRDKILQSVEKKKMEGKKKVFGKITVGYAPWNEDGADVPFIINKFALMRLARKTFDIDSLQPLTKLLSKRYKLFYWDYEGKEYIGFDFFGFFGNKSNFCKSFIKELTLELNSCGVKFSSLSRGGVTTQAKIRYSCNTQEYKPPIFPYSDIEKAFNQHFKGGTEKLLSNGKKEQTQDGQFVYTATFHTPYLSRNIELKYIFNTQRFPRTQAFLGILSLNIGRITNPEAANRAKEAFNLNSDKYEGFIAGAEKDFCFVKTFFYTDFQTLSKQLTYLGLKLISLAISKDLENYKNFTT